MIRRFRLKERGKIVDIRYSANAQDFRHYTAEQIRREYLVENLFVPDDIVTVYTHVDRMVTIGCMPVSEQISIDKGTDIWANFGTKYFLERRELGIFNIGGKGTVHLDSDGEFELGFHDCLYVSMGTKEVSFSSKVPEKPAQFYMVSAPAHCPYPTMLIPIEKASKRTFGDQKNASVRTVNKFIHPDVLKTCQLTMGLLQIHENSVWNTMPTHTHERRMEIYFYTEIPDKNVVFHLMGRDDETRHIVVRNNSAVICPSWSIHSGVGTANYSLIWAMGGENQVFEDMDEIETVKLK